MASNHGTEERRIHDHGGNIDEARARFGGEDWIDLSTGISRRPWPVGQIMPEIWSRLPTHTDNLRAIRAASEWFGCPPDSVLPVPGASAAIATLPRLLGRGEARVLTPTYNEHAASLRASGWRVSEVTDFSALSGADLAVVVNPNNPDGREWPREALRALATSVGHLLIDESFADARPDLSLAGDVPQNAIILRSFGKFWGLAGLRLGFVIARPAILDRLASAMGPWPVNGPALHIATEAMSDRLWAEDTIVYHSEASLRLDRLALAAGWKVVGGTHLFRLYDTGNAARAQTEFAEHRIWTRRFPYTGGWLRLGVPGNRAEWDRVIDAFNACAKTRSAAPAP